jgi:hypothetical protein
VRGLFPHRMVAAPNAFIQRSFESPAASGLSIKADHARDGAPRRSRHVLNSALGDASTGQSLASAALWQDLPRRQRRG